MKKLIISFICMSALFLSCSEMKGDYPILFENFTLPQDMRPTLSSLFTDSYEITTLETTNESLIGRIEKIRKFNGNYYILSSGQSILQFNKQGKFVAALDRHGQGPEEYHRIEDFDIYEIDGQTEVWISDNISLKIYDAKDFQFKYTIPLPFIIHKFKRLENSNLLLVTGKSEYSLTLTDKEGNIISEYLKKEIPFLMFRPIQFIAYGSDYIFQLGISNAYVGFNQKTETFYKGVFTNDKSYLTDKELLHLFNRHGMNFIGEANKGIYISNLQSFNDIIWINTYNAGKNYLTKVQPEKIVSTIFSYESTIDNDLFEMDNSLFVSTFTTGESDDSFLLYLDPYTLSNDNKLIFDKYGNPIYCSEEDNPCILEFF